MSVDAVPFPQIESLNRLKMIQSTTACDTMDVCSIANLSALAHTLSGLAHLSRRMQARPCETLLYCATATLTCFDVRTQIVAEIIKLLGTPGRQLQDLPIPNR